MEEIINLFVRSIETLHAKFEKERQELLHEINLMLAEHSTDIVEQVDVMFQNFSEGFNEMNDKPGSPDVYKYIPVVETVEEIPTRPASVIYPTTSPEYQRMKSFFQEHKLMDLNKDLLVQTVKSFVPTDVTEDDLIGTPSLTFVPPERYEELQQSLLKVYGLI